MLENLPEEVSLPENENKKKFLKRLRTLLNKKFNLENPSEEDKKELSELARRLMKFYNRYMKKVLIQSVFDDRRYFNPKGDKDQFKVEAAIRRFPGLR